SGPGRTTVRQVETVPPGRLATIAMTARTLTLRRGMTYPFGASGFDAYGNAVAIWPHWSATMGKFSKLDGTSTTYKPDKRGTATLTATSGVVTASVRVTVS